MSQTAIDAAGILHQPAGDAPRIACLVPSITELVFALGLGDRLVARTTYCIHPSAGVAKIPSVGGTKKINLDRLRALAPTHAIVNIEENTRDMYDALRASVPHVIVTYPRAPDDNPPLYRLLGAIFGREAEADVLAARYASAAARIAAARAALPRRQVLYFVWKEPWLGVSRGTYIAGTLALAGWEVLGHSDTAAYPPLDLTPDLLDRADAILFATEPYDFAKSDLDDFARRYACPRAKLHLIDGAYTSWYGPRAIDGLDYLRAFAERLAA